MYLYDLDIQLNLPYRHLCNTGASLSRTVYLAQEIPEVIQILPFNADTIPSVSVFD